MEHWLEPTPNKTKQTEQYQCTLSFKRSSLVVTKAQKLEWTFNIDSVSSHLFNFFPSASVIAPFFSITITKSDWLMLLHVTFSPDHPARWSSLYAGSLSLEHPALPRTLLLFPPKYPLYLVSVLLESSLILPVQFYFPTLVELFASHVVAPWVTLLIAPFGSSLMQFLSRGMPVLPSCAWPPLLHLSGFSCCPSVDTLPCLWSPTAYILWMLVQMLSHGLLLFHRF